MSLHCEHNKTCENVDLNNIFRSKPKKTIKSIDIKKQLWLEIQFILIENRKETANRDDLETGTSSCLTQTINHHFILGVLPKICSLTETRTAG